MYHPRLQRATFGTSGGAGPQQGFSGIYEEGKGWPAHWSGYKASSPNDWGVNADQVVPSAEFIGDLNADSLDLVEVIMAMEQEFDLEIKDEEAENIRTVGDAVKFIDEHGQS